MARIRLHNGRRSSVKWNEREEERKSCQRGGSKYNKWNKRGTKKTGGENKIDQTESSVSEKTKNKKTLVRQENWNWEKG